MHRRVMAAGCALVLALPATTLADSLAPGFPGDSSPAEEMDRSTAPEQMDSMRERQRRQDEILLREQLRLQREGHDAGELHRQLELQRQRQAVENIPGEPDRPEPRERRDPTERTETTEPLDQTDAIGPDQELTPGVLPEHETPPLHDPQQGDPLADRPQPEPSQPLQ